MIFTENLTLAARILYNDIINLLFEMGEAAMILIFEQPDYARSVRRRISDRSVPSTYSSSLTVSPSAS